MGAVELTDNSLFHLVLLTEVKSLDNSTVTLDINLLQVLEQVTTLTYQAKQCSLGTEVVLVALKVLCKVADTV